MESTTAKPAARASKPAAAKKPAARKRAPRKPSAGAQAAEAAAKAARVARKVSALQERAAQIADAQVSVGSIMPAGMSQMSQEVRGLQNIVAASGFSEPMESVEDEYREEDGLTLSEISSLLQRRERSGYQRGARETSRRMRRDFSQRLAQERNDAVAGSLKYAVELLVPIAEKLAAQGVMPAAVRDGRAELVELVASLSKQYQRIGGAGE